MSDPDLHPARRGVMIGIVVLAFAAALGARLGFVDGALPRAGGPWVWISSRAAGVAAYMGLTVEIAFGLFLSTGAADRWIARARMVEIHRWLSGGTLGWVACHALLLLGDAYVRFDLLDVAVPFVAPYRPAAVGLGILAAYAAFLVHWSFSLRKRIGFASWRRLHSLSFAVFVLATAHGVLGGSDAGLPWMRAMYTVSAALVASLVLHRAIPVLAASRLTKQG